jgi:diacylglycerol kinase (ATP)
MSTQRPPVASAGSAGEPANAYKSRGGLGRMAAAMRYSLRGLQAAWRHEAAFRQELAVGVPLLLSVPWLAPGRWQAVAMVASILLVFVVELLNSAVEAIADAVTVDENPLLGRAKDLGSAAVLVSLLMAAGVWGLVLWP